MSLLRSRLINDIDASLRERQAGLERILNRVPIDLIQAFARQGPPISGTDLAVIALASDGSVLAATPSGPPDEPDPLPVLDAGVVESLSDSDEPFTVDGESDGYRVIAETVGDSEITLVLAQPLDDVANTMRGALTVLIVVGTGAAVMLGGSIWFLIRRELRPLDTMARTADRITEGDLSQRVGIARPTTEVGRLGGALNSMLGRIEDAVEAKTESEDRMRRFVADASHELRTPLTSIRGYAELYRSGGNSPEHVARSFERIEQEANRMGGLVEDLVLLARLDRERPFTIGEVDVAEVVREAVADARAIEPDREVTTSIGAGTLMAHGDPDRLRQVVANLLGNVRTHTGPDTPATVSVDREGDWVVVAVSDEGAGMEPEATQQAFERFYQATADRTTPGSGLGLAIVRSIIDRHGGTVELNSAVGEGTTVTLRVPAA